LLLLNFRIKTICRISLCFTIFDTAQWSIPMASPRNAYLLKTEPDQYSFNDLRRDGETVWDGVTNPVALKHLREMKVGDHLVIYHTGDERRAVGTATVSSIGPVEGKDPRVRIRARHAIAHPKELAEIKAAALFTESPLVRQGRLSVVPLTAEQYDWLTG
jgi:predicted RNA-binding protein with PUA-like domain